MHTITLQRDRYQFVIVTSKEELVQAKTEAHAQVKVTCPGCCKLFLKTLGHAEFILQYGCQHHIL